MIAYFVWHKNRCKLQNPSSNWGVFKQEIFVDEPSEEILIQEFEDEHEARMEAQRLYDTDPKNSNKYHRGKLRG